uniref:G-protein coupled receptors family 1 profile domain-containing protein n=1 Tax=Mola mola TaxID=94237 RepID=A0A3Q4B0J8_MOLML
MQEAFPLFTVMESTFQSERHPSTRNFTHGFVLKNETLAQHSYASKVPPEITLPVFMFVGGALGNVIAIIVLSVSRQGRKSSAFYTLVSGLAVTDLLGTCLASPFTIANYLDQNVLNDQRVCEFQSFLLLFFSLAGLSIICAMAAERYLAICCAYTYERWGVDRRFAQKFLLFIYISHIFFCCLPAMGMARSQPQPSGNWCFIDWATEELVAAVYMVVYGVVSALLILGTIVLNLRTVHRALSSAAETQMIALLVMTSVVVLACSAPLVVSRTRPTYDLAAIRIASVNPILNPWIYILFRKSLFYRLLGVFRRRSSTAVPIWRGICTFLGPNPWTELVKCTERRQH